MDRIDVAFVQTADAGPYLDMMHVTSRTVRAYCERHEGCSYEAFVGVRRGWWPWQATFNRIYLLQELVERGRHDWAVYMDADAYISDLRFELTRYLRRKNRYAAVMTPSGATKAWWDVNAGVLMLNLRHPFTSRLLASWRAAYEAIPEGVLRAQSTWSNPNDQEMLHLVLQEDDEAREMVHRAPRKLVNSAHARFIQQMVSAFFPDFESRLRAVQTRVDEVLGPRPSREVAEGRAAAEDFVDKLYLAGLRRSADPAGLAHFAPLVQHLGYEAGARQCLEAMLKSEEYLAARLTANG